ncbi:hypothetical protein B296_00045760 [Ensete ventricosum]|uniref:Uncharacterized protein n=1 Tax=Ensete ventricosum TaxID=4639 RepID=A0A426Z6A3_ENSVE|nr:hypothetical protein B296_00045760 [Ensete ventricosum]
MILPPGSGRPSSLRAALGLEEGGKFEPQALSSVFFSFLSQDNTLIQLLICDPCSISKGPPVFGFTKANELFVGRFSAAQHCILLNRGNDHRKGCVGAAKHRDRSAEQ